MAHLLKQILPPLHLQHLYPVLTVALIHIWRMIQGATMTVTILMRTLENVTLMTDTTLIYAYAGKLNLYLTITVLVCLP